MIELEALVTAQRRLQTISPHIILKEGPLFPPAGSLFLTEQ